MLQKNSNSEAIRTGSSDRLRILNAKQQTKQNAVKIRHKISRIMKWRIKTLLKLLKPEWLLHLITEADKARRLLPC